MARLFPRAKSLLFYGFFAAYLLLLAWLLLFKYVSPLALFDPGRVLERTYNLVPFRTINLYVTRVNVWIALMNVAGNVAIFVPLGLYLQVFKRKKGALRCVAWCGAISLGVEAVQYVLGIGAADIDDVLLNTLGGLLGAWLYSVLLFWRKDQEKVKTSIVVLWCALGLCCLLLMGYVVFFTNLKVRLF